MMFGYRSYQEFIPSIACLHELYKKQETFIRVNCCTGRGRSMAVAERLSLKEAITILEVKFVDNG